MDHRRSDPPSPTVFFAITYALSWTLWIPLLLWSQGRGEGTGEGATLEGLPAWIGALWFLGSWSPSLVGLALTARSGGRVAVRRLLRSALEWRIGVRWHLITWVGPAAVGLLAMILYAAGGGNAPAMAPGRWVLLPVALVLAVPFGPLGEEFGWRGYALSPLLESHSALGASVIVGLGWMFWHLPLFWAPAGTTISGNPVTAGAVALYTVEIVSLSILLTWLYLGTGRSLLAVVGAHAAWNAGMARFLFEPQGEEAATAAAGWSALLLAAAASAVVVRWYRAGSSGA